MKYFIVISFTLLTLLACNNQKGKNMATTPNEEIVKQYFEYFNNDDWVKMANMYSESSEFKDPSLGKGIVKQTREQIVKKYSELSQMFPDVKDEVINIYPSGEKHIIVEFKSTGTAPDNSRFELPICTIFTIENGLITKDFTYYDNFEE